LFYQELNMSDIERSNEFAFSVVTAHPTRRERQLALAVIGITLVGLAAVAPFADIPLLRLGSFIPSIQVIISITSIITAVLLFGQFWTVGSRGVLVLAAGYLFVALIVVSHILTFPGAFSPTGLLGAGAQTAGWLYLFWHFGFAVSVFGYVLLKDAKSPARYAAGFSIAWTVTAVVGLVCLLTWIFTAKEQSLPVLFADSTSFTLLALYSTGVDSFLSALALALLWRRGRSTLDMWLCVTISAFLAELVINTVFISGRFTLGWYSGRVFAVLVTTIVLILMLAQTFALNARLMRATIMLQRERSNKLAGLDAVVAAIAHEVRQPLATIAVRGAATKRYLDRTPPGLREAGSGVDAMVASSMRANEIFENIRALFSDVDQKKQPVNVNQLAAEALDLLREELKAYGIETSIQQTPELPSIMAHNGQLREVILNLIQNAIEAMRAVSDRRRILRIRTGPHGNGAIVISVEDTGLGIEPEKLQQMFDPFVSTKAKGRGLGLAICRSIIERHHGQLSVSSEIDGGARFQLILPVRPTAQPELPNPSLNVLQMPGG
jgi:signal transduction histidine kinase